MLRLPFRHHPSRLEVFLSLALKEGIKNIYSTTFINICCNAQEIHLSLFTPYYEYKNITNEYVRYWYFCKNGYKCHYKISSDELQSTGSSISKWLFWIWFFEHFHNHFTGIFSFKSTITKGNLIIYKSLYWFITFS